MNGVREVIRKDLRRLWVLSLAWNVWVLLRNLDLLHMATTPFERGLSGLVDAKTELLYPGFNGSFLTFTCIAVALHFLLTDDPPWDPRAFWSTRPISSRQLIGAKLTSFVVSFLLLPVLLHLGLFLALGMAVGDWLRAAAWLAATLLGWSILVVAVMAVIRRPLGQALTLLFAIPLYGRIASLLIVGIGYPSYPSASASFIELQAFLPLNLGLAALWCLVFLGLTHKPWRVRDRWIALVLLTVLPFAVLFVELKLYRVTMKVAQGLSLSVIDQAPTEDVEAGIYGPLGVALEFYLETAPTTTPQPATYWWLNDVEVTIAVPDRSLVLTPTTYAGEILGDEQAVLTALGGAKTTGSLKHHEAIYEEVDPRPSVAVFIDPDTYLSNSEREVRLTGVALLGETHLRMVGTMPLEKGASLRRGPTTLQILSIQSNGSRPWALDGSGDALVRVASRWIDPTPRTRACSYVFVIYDPQQNTALGAFWNIGSRALPALLSPPSLRVRASTLKLEHSWLTRGAELVVLEDCLGPLVRAPFSLDRFRMVDYTKAAHRKRMELEGAQTTANTSEAENGS